ncbi:hypothetical protein ACFQZQ_03485 [Lysobacter koreensis]|uniref:Cytochrome c n=1 Tax=Lysobacter koreensis TaxID=266122 RepID=A0ABW2YJ99_9GAMM
MSTTAPTQPSRTHAAKKYLFLFLLGLAVGAFAVVMVMRSLEARKTWSDHYPDAAMHYMQAQVAQLDASVETNRCAATETLPRLKALRTVADDLELAFPGLRDDKRFVGHASKLRGTLDAALASPPLSCEGVTKLMAGIGADCKACHQDFRN